MLYVDFTLLIEPSVDGSILSMYMLEASGLIVN
jgi:hypothetical protein